MNRFEKLLGLKGEARLRYSDGEFQVLNPGDFVRCAVTGEPIALPDLRYWSVELQEAYASAKLLGSLGYQGVLRRGYALVRDGEGRTVRYVAQVASGQRLDIELADGHVDAQALGSRAKSGGEPPQPRPAPPPRAKGGAGGGNQGSLF